MKRILYIFFFLMTLGFLGCTNNNKAEADTAQLSSDPNTIQVTKAQFDSNAMQLVAISPQAFYTTVNTTGMIDVPPENRAVVSAFSGGYIKTTPLLIGDKVQKGQALVTLENPEFVEMQQRYLEVKEQLTYLKSEYDRQEQLVAEKITSQKNFLKAESEYKTAVATYNGLKKKLQMLNINPGHVEQGYITAVTTIYAPISGSITQINVRKGVYVSPADEILEIIDADHIHLELSVFEKDVMKVKEDQEIRFTIPEASALQYIGEVHLVGTSIDEKSRTVKVHGHLKEDVKNNFTVGMFVNAQIVIDKLVKPALPKDAVVTSGDKSYALLLKSSDANGYTFSKVEIQTQPGNDGYILVEDSNSFKPTDRFLGKGAFHLIQEE